MLLDILTLLFSFTLFSIIGWLIEVVYRSFEVKYFVNPGLLHGPYLILYGFGALLIIALSLSFKPSVAERLLLYFVCLTGLELTAGLICQKIFKVNLWNYSDEKFNYNGYICLKYSIYWVLLAVAFEYIMLPHYQNSLAELPTWFKITFTCIALTSMIVDLMLVISKRLLGMEPKEKAQKISKFLYIARPVVNHPDVARLSIYKHHKFKSRLRHVIEVAYISFLWSDLLRLENKSIVRGALLHDLFYYDWLQDGPRFHGFRHHNIALRNAQAITNLSKKEEDIIKKHMWPLTIIPPRYIESYIVSMVDTFCSVKDYLYPECNNKKFGNFRASNQIKK